MITFAEYMDRVLYGPAGYYSTGTAKSGKAGDYFTAPDVGPAFGQLLSEIFSMWKEKLDADPFSIIECGAGEGKLAADILASHPFHYLAVERSAYRCEVLKKLKVEFLRLEVHHDLSMLKEKPLEGVLFGNELIDAFPVHRIQFKNGRLLELFVDEAQGKRRFVWGEPSTPKLQAYVDRLGLSFPNGYETEVNLVMAKWLAEAATVLQRGLVVLIDYGRPAYEYYAPERTRGTLRAFSKHKVSADFLNPSGMVDLTADVDFSSLALDAIAAGFMPLAFMEMGTFLTPGLQKMVEEGKTKISGMAIKHLLHPEGMGSAFHVLVLGKGVDPTDWYFEHNRLRRL